MGNILPMVFEPVFNICINLFNKSMIGLYDLTLKILSFLGYSPVSRWPRGTGLTLWENYSENYGTLTLKHYEDLNERVLCLTLFSNASQIVCKVLMKERKRFGAITQCYVFKETRGTDRVEIVKIPTATSVNRIVEIFKAKFDD